MDCLSYLCSFKFYDNIQFICKTNTSKYESAKKKKSDFFYFSHFFLLIKVFVYFYFSIITSPQAPAHNPAAFASSISICISRRKLSSTLITTLSKTSPLSPGVFTFTISPSVTPKSSASATVM